MTMFIYKLQRPGDNNIENDLFFSLQELHGNCSLSRMSVSEEPNRAMAETRGFCEYTQETHTHTPSGPLTAANKCTRISWFRSLISTNAPTFTDLSFSLSFLFLFTQSKPILTAAAVIVTYVEQFANKSIGLYSFAFFS